MNSNISKKRKREEEQYEGESHEEHENQPEQEQEREQQNQRKEKEDTEGKGEIIKTEQDAVHNNKNNNSNLLSGKPGAPNVPDVKFCAAIKDDIKGDDIRDYDYGSKADIKTDIKAASKADSSTKAESKADSKDCPLYEMDYHDTPEISWWFKTLIYGTPKSQLQPSDQLHQLHQLQHSNQQIIGITHPALKSISHILIFFVRKYGLPRGNFPNPQLVRWIMKQNLRVPPMIGDKFELYSCLNESFDVHDVDIINDGPEPRELHAYRCDLKLKPSGEILQNMNAHRIFTLFSKRAIASVHKQDKQDFFDRRKEKLSTYAPEDRIKYQNVIDKCRANQEDFIQKYKDFPWFIHIDVNFHKCDFLSGRLTQCSSCGDQVCDKFIADDSGWNVNIPERPLCYHCNQEMEKSEKSARQMLELNE